jgi:uncharacterized protein
VEILFIAVLIFTGLAVGVISGLLGVGGAFIMVPVQYWVLTSLNFDPTMAMRVSFGTSLAVILPTALSGCYGHSCLGCVLWRPGLALGLSGLLGAFMGGSIAAHAPVELLKLIFGVTVLLGAFRMIFAKKIKPGEKPNGSLPFYVILGFMIGILSGVSGIGGGIILVPMMFGFMGFSILEAIGTSALVIAMNSIGGILSYALNGLDVSGLPPYSIGYINLLIFVLLAGTSVLAAQFGVRFAHKLPDEKLRIILIALMILIGLKMIGAFEWFGSFL